MIACLDVHYAEGRATAACIRFRHWADEKSVDVVTASMDTVAAYESGEFYKRELAPLLRVLERSGQSAQTLVIDGYVWLDAQGSPGLEALLYAATGGQSRVIGIAKNPLKNADLHTMSCAAAALSLCMSRPSAWIQRMLQKGSKTCMGPTGFRLWSGRRTGSQETVNESQELAPEGVPVIACAV